MSYIPSYKITILINELSYLFKDTEKHMLEQYDVVEFHKKYCNVIPTIKQQPLVLSLVRMPIGNVK